MIYLKSKKIHNRLVQLVESLLIVVGLTPTDGIRNSRWLYL